jgi:hypothetical protein
VCVQVFIERSVGSFVCVCMCVNVRMDGCVSVTKGVFEYFAAKEDKKECVRACVS